MTDKLKHELARTGLDIGFAIREKINSIPRYQRGDLTTSVLKPYYGANAKLADAEGEKVGFELLKKLSEKTDKKVKVVIDPSKDAILEIGNQSDSKSIYAYLDAVDGTMKVAGLFSEPEKRIYRVGNNGVWSTGIAFTMPTQKDLSELSFGDFEISAIVDGNPTSYRSYPTNAFVRPNNEIMKVFEKDEQSGNCYELHTSSQTDLSKGTVLFDSFQAFDRKSAKPGSEELASKVFSRLMNRNSGGAFDIVRMYSNMGEVLRQCLERSESDHRYEPQSVGSLTINENLPNLMPVRPVIENAGGYAVDFEGNPIREKKLKTGRQNVIIAANPGIKESLLKIVKL